MDTHPTKPWIITGHECGRVYIRNHDMQKLLYMFKVSRGPVWSVKFIARKQWFICSSAEGLVHLYGYETEPAEMQRIKSFRADNHGGDTIGRMWLAVHPNQPYVLSLSSREHVKQWYDDFDEDHYHYEDGMRLWDWDKGWECTQTFDTTEMYGERSLDSEDLRSQIAFDPNKTNRCFATTSSFYNTVTVWSLDSPQPEYHLPADRICGRDDNVEFLEFFTYDDGRQYLIILFSNKTLHIWDMQQRKFIFTEEQSNSLSLESHIFSNPNLPILLTTPFRGIFLFRSPKKDLSIQAILDNSDGGCVCGIAPLMRSKTRFAIGQENALTILDIDHGKYEEDQRQSSDPHIFTGTIHGDTIYEVITQESSELTYVHPLKVHFSFQDDKLIPCLLHLTNNIDKHVAFMLSSTTKDQLFQMMTPSGDIVPLRSTYTLNLKTPQEEKHFNLILQSCISGDRYIYRFTDQSECDQFFEDAKETGNVVQEVLEIALSQQGETMSSENGPTGQDVTQPLIKIRGMFHPAVENDILYSLYVDPTESWIITGNGKREIFIRNFDTQEMVYTMNSYCDICSVKIIASKQWVVVGTCDGFINVYEYETGMKSIKRLKAKSRSKDLHGALVVHPNLPYVLSFFDDEIQLWDWDKEWECIQTFEQEHDNSIAQVTFSPKDTNIFASASSDCTIKLWSLSSCTSEYTLHGHCNRVNCLDFFTSEDAEQYLISGSQDCKDSPYIATGSEDGIVHLWSSTSFRLERVLNIGRRGAVQSLCLMGSKRVVIKKMGTISIMDLDTVSKEHQELQVHPTLLEFELRPGKLSSCSLQLTNDTDEDMAFKLSTTSESEDCWSKHFTTELPLHGIVPAQSTCTLILTVFLEREDIPEKTSCDMILDSCTKSDLPTNELYVYSYDKSCKALFDESSVKKVKNGVKLTAILTSEHMQSIDGAAPTTRVAGAMINPQISWMEKPRRELFSVDAHPTKPWIITGEECGRVSIWNHDTQKLLCSTEFSGCYGAVFCVKFIARKQWFIAASSAAGLVHVYSYEETEATEIIMREIKRFQPYGPYCCVSLAVHPKQPYVMTWGWNYSNDDDGMMKLWDWDQGWECTRTFQSGHVRLLAFDPKETDRFTTAAWDKVTVWSLHSPGEPEYYLPSKDRDFDENVMSLEFFTRYGRQYLIIFTADTSAHIWDMQQRKFINVKHTNSLSPSVFSHHHPNPPMLLARLYEGICRFWSPKNFRLKGILDNRAGGYVCGVARLMGSKTRFVIGQRDALTILDMDNGIHQEDEMQSIDPNLCVDTRQGDTGSEDFILSTILDHPDWQGIDNSSKLRCHHNRPPRKKVCWDRKDTGRRFFGCYEPDETLQCSFIHWVDKEWPASAQWAMKKLWEEIEKNRKELADTQEKNNELAGALADAQEDMSALGQALAEAQGTMKC